MEENISDSLTISGALDALLSSTSGPSAENLDEIQLQQLINDGENSMDTINNEQMPSWYDTMLSTLAHSDALEAADPVEMQMIDSNDSSDTTETPTNFQSSAPTPSALTDSNIDPGSSRIVEIDIKNISLSKYLNQLSPLDGSNLSREDKNVFEDQPASTSNEDIVKWLETQPKLTPNSKNGYILYSMEVRKEMLLKHPNATFIEMSRIIGQEWKKLPDLTKQKYDAKAKFIADQREKFGLAKKILLPGQIFVYHCKWQMCDYQFGSKAGWLAHMQRQHLPSSLTSANVEFECLWTSCLKYRNNGTNHSKPFNSYHKLLRHLKEKHMLTCAKIIYPQQHGKHFFAYRTINERDDVFFFVHVPYGQEDEDPLYTDKAIPFPKSCAQDEEFVGNDSQQQQNKLAESLPGTSTTVHHPNLVYALENGQKNDQEKMPLCKPGQIMIYYCLWNTCDYEFDSAHGLSEHIRRQHLTQTPFINGVFECCWAKPHRRHNDSRFSKYNENRLWRSLDTLFEHIKLKHISVAGLPVYPNEKGRHFFVYNMPNTPIYGYSHQNTFVHQPFGANIPNPIYAPEPTPRSDVIYNLPNEYGVNPAAYQPTLIHHANDPGGELVPNGSIMNLDQQLNTLNGIVMVQDGMTTPFDPMLGEYAGNRTHGEIVLETGEIVSNSTTEMLLKLVESNETSANETLYPEMEIQDQTTEVKAVSTNFALMNGSGNLQDDIILLRQKNERLESEREMAYAHAEDIAMQLDKALGEIRNLKSDRDNLKEAVIRNLRVVQSTQKEIKELRNENNNLKVVLSKNGISWPIKMPSKILPFNNNFLVKTPVTIPNQQVIKIERPSTSTPTSKGGNNQNNRMQSINRVVREGRKRHAKADEENNEQSYTQEKKVKIERNSAKKSKIASGPDPTYDDVLRDLYEVLPLDKVYIDIPPCPDIKKFRHYRRGSKVVVPAQK